MSWLAPHQTPIQSGNIQNIYVYGIYIIGYTLHKLTSLTSFISIDFYWKLDFVLPVSTQKWCIFHGRKQKQRINANHNWQWTCSRWQSLWQSFNTNIEFANPNVRINPLLSGVAGSQRGLANYIIWLSQCQLTWSWSMLPFWTWQMMLWRRGVHGQYMTLQQSTMTLQQST
jgi:hypothetical protein